MEQERGLAGRGRALERRVTDADDRAAARERGKHLRQSRRAGKGIELVPCLGEPRRGIQVVIRAERQYQDVSLMHGPVGRHAARFWIDCRDRLLQKPHSRLRDLTVREPNSVERRAPEHHVQLRVAEHERVVLVDQGHVHPVAQRLGQHGRKLETSETCT